MKDVTRRTALGFFLAAARSQGQTGTGPAAEWTAFMEWATAVPPDSFPGTGSALLAAYRAKLLQDRLSSAEADKAIASIRREKANHPTDFQKLFYDKAYAMKEPIGPSAPNAFLVEVTRELRPGEALDVGMGEGRNSIFLAQHGWNVTGIDLSDVGVAKAKKRAESLGLKLHTIVGDADKFDFGSQRWDLVCVFYFSGAGLVHDLQKRVAASFKTGGYMVNEGPLPAPKTLDDAWSAWEPFGFKLLRLEYHGSESEWGQPSFGRLPIQKT